ncbi:PucR family transcriptional regulator [Sporolactobacillus shoreicorticis]|uniref:PucR family transcriptional regulator n=1 Tax=Sporolactobacillus shoreicorticis TaxID=1923877 RepID=A0ABW5S2A4_9BACL|nr:PucR family transcriptional regulator [Sporolactobacillus shoreicorticis]MCO7126444.1 PucR family transcriptional regulator [Sporolactobacillus shoreicorticis]
MPDVASLQQFEFFSNFTLYAGAKGIHRMISNVVILDHEGFDGNYTDFHEGDFVITNLLYAKDNPERILPSFSKLISIKVAAIAIKSIYYHELPKEVVELAEAHSLPVFFFDSVYIEDIILNIVDYLRSSEKISYLENLVDTVIYTETPETALKQLLSHCCPDHRHYVSSLYLTDPSSKDKMSLQNRLNRNSFSGKQFIDSSDVSFLIYKKGVLMLYFSEEVQPSSEIMKNWRHILSVSNLSPGDYQIGVDDEMLPIRQIDIAIRRSIYTNRCCAQQDHPRAVYSSMHLRTLMLSLSENRYAHAYLTDLCKKISAYDRRHNTRLMETLYAYAGCLFHIDKTAKKLTQHPNTIRYRLNKIKSILHCTNDFEFQIIVGLISETLS